MKIYTPLEVSTSHTTIEHDRKFYWVATIKLHISMSTGKVEFEQNCISDIIESMGNQILPDMGMPKPQAEYLLNGHYYAPNNEAVIADQATIKFNNSIKSINVFGDREWFASIPSKPQPLIKLPLSYEHAYGGDESKLNPIGKGLNQQELPNIELSGQSITSNKSQYSPAGFSPLDPSWFDRAKYQGTYDDKYLEKYFPGYPMDTDWRLFMTAPQDQWCKVYLEGNEEYELINVHPDKPVVYGKLPNLTPRCFIKRTAKSDVDDAIAELNLNLDTAWFFPDADVIQLIWRAMIPAENDDAEDISHMLVAYENKADAPRSKEHYKEALERRITNNDPLENNLTTKDIVPIGMQSSIDRLKDSALEDVKVNAFSENMKAKSDKIESSVNTLVNDSMTEAKEKISSSVDDNTKKKELIDQLSSISNNHDDDPDIKLVMEKLNNLLPGASNNNPKDLELGLFSFKKIDALMQEIQSFSDKKKIEVIEKISPTIKKLKDDLANIDSKSINYELDTEKLKQQIEDLENIGKEIPPPPQPLPRFNTEAMIETLNTSSLELKKAKNELHLILTNPLMNTPDMVSNVKEKIEALEQQGIDNIGKDLSNAKLQFHDAYLMGAHFSPDGLSPHENDKAVQLDLLNKIANNMPVSHQDWACLDLKGQDLTGIDFTGCLLEQVDFTDCNLTNVNFSKAILSRSIFSNAKCHNTNFTNANLGAITAEKADFSTAVFEDTKLSYSQFNNCNFDNSSIKNPELLDIVFSDCSFEHSSLENWNIIDTPLKKLNFSHASISGFCFINCQLKGCNFDFASLPSTVWSDTSIKDTSFISANMANNCTVKGDDAEISLVRLNFKNTDLSNSNLQNLTYIECNFYGAKLLSTNLMGSDLRDNSFEDCQANKALFSKANLDHSDFTGSNLMEAIFSKATLTNTNFKGANLFGADFMRSKVKHSNFNHANLDATILVDWRPS